MVRMDVQTLNVYNKCNILSASCTLNVGDTIQVGCYAFWDDDAPMKGISVILRFSGNGKSHDAWLSGVTSDRGWLAKNHVVTKEDIEDLGTTGDIQLYTHSYPSAWSLRYAIHYPQLYCSQNVRVVTSDGASVSAHIVWGDGTDEYGTTPKTFTRRYEEGNSRTVTVSASGYASASKTFTTCRSQFTLTLKKEAVTCVQSVKVKTSDNKTVYATIDYGDGGIGHGNTPITFTHSLKKGDAFTIKVSAAGYTSASRRINSACVSQFTLTLKKEAAAVCSDYTTKSTCEAHGCFWYSNACHKYGPVKCSDYTDALTCAANNCYWWKDGTCHDTEEVVGPEKWKTVSEPYWENSKVRIDVEANLSSSKNYWGAAYGGIESFGNRLVLTSNSPKGAIRLSDLNRIKKYYNNKVTIKLQEPCSYQRSACECPTFDSVTKTIPPKVVPKDTVICDFDVYDASGNKVTDLVAGVRYAIKAWLCKVEGGGCAEILKGCDSGCKVSGETLKLFLIGRGVIAEGTTNENGYTAFFWTPSADIAGDNSIRMNLIGTTNYKHSETAWKTVKVIIVIPPPPPPPPPPILKDSVICSFDIVDAEGESATELVVGARYTVKCNIYEKTILGCAAPLKKELIGEEIKFIKT